MPLITINQVQKYYGQNHVLKGVDLDIEGARLSASSAAAAPVKALCCAA